MHAIKTIAAAAAIALSTTTATTVNEGTVALFEHTDFGGDPITINVEPLDDNVGKCFNINKCINDGASSAKWNLTLEGKVIFYTDKNCEGESREWPSKTDNPPADFVKDGINDAISSMAIHRGKPTKIDSYEECSGISAAVQKALAHQGFGK